MKAKAFTLLELLLVVVMMSLLAVLSQPFFSRGQELRQARGAAETVVSLLRYARVRAMTEQVVFRVAFGERDFVLLRAAEEKDGSGQGSFSPVDGSMGRPRVLPDGISFYGRPQEIYCYPDGRMDRVRFAVKSKSANVVISTKEYMGHVFIQQDNAPQ